METHILLQSIHIDTSFGLFSLTERIGGTSTGLERKGYIVRRGVGLAVTEAILAERGEITEFGGGALALDVV